jgi:hypothetical protein
MKNMLRFACLLAAVSFGAPQAEAQLKKFSFGPYVEAAFPAGNFSNLSTVGYGAGFGVDIKLPMSLSATASFGLMHFGGKDYPGSTLAYPAVNAFPLRIGAKYGFGKIFYAGLETGAVFLSKSGGSAGILAPAIGVRFLNIDIRAKNESWFKSGTSNFWGLQASLRF